MVDDDVEDDEEVEEDDEVEEGGDPLLTHAT